MRKRLLCEARFDLQIEVAGPLLIKSGQPTLDGPDMTPVVTFGYGGEQPHPYIPGTSLKGVLRSHIERIARTLARSRAPVCLPYEKKPGPECSCGHRISKEVPKPEAYRDSCLACKIFGSLQFRGRTVFQDAYAPDPRAIQTEVRDGVAIDRKTGGAAGGAKYDLQVVVAGTFETSIAIENFEAWQLGILALALRDMEAGRVPLGMGSSRGLGQIEASIQGIELRYPFNYSDKGVLGIESLCTAEEVDAYGLSKAPPSTELLSEPEEDGLWDVYHLAEKEQRDGLIAWSRRAFSEYLKEYQWDGGAAR